MKFDTIVFVVFCIYNMFGFYICVSWADRKILKKYGKKKGLKKGKLVLNLYFYPLKKLNHAYLTQYLSEEEINDIRKIKKEGHKIVAKFLLISLGLFILIFGIIL